MKRDVTAVVKLFVKYISELNMDKKIIIFIPTHFPFGKGINGREYGEVMLDELERCFPSAENYLIWK